MFGLRRRAIGGLFLAIGAGCLVAPLLFGNRFVPTVPQLADPASLIAVVPPSLAGAGAVLVVAGVAALRNRRPDARGAFAAPVLGALVAAAAVLVAVSTETTTARATVEWVLSVPPALQFAVGGVLAGGGVAPVTLGAVADDVPALLAGAVLVLAAVSGSPAPMFVVLAALGGVLAVAIAWVVDADGWHP
ncbi:hypothetical protein [Haloparvum sp. PAK95]|uniref:hypothetical protein n=1 Tax=Haloparvum sp. PAK95 TaxID=3418962 RepID=UPI003D2EFDD9